MGTYFFCEMNDNKSASKQNTKIILHFSMEVIIIPHIAIGNELWSYRLESDHQLNLWILNLKQVIST